MPIKFVDDIKAHLKRYSVIALGALAAIQPVWLGLDATIKDGVPAWLSMGVNTALALAGIVGALLKQGVLSEPKE